jgi:DNA-binding XRE family transcriptional regulator
MRPFAFIEVQMIRTIVYIDGFNLYFRALKGTPHKWLDIAKMSAATLPSGHQIDAVNFYTARVSGRIDPTSPARQNTYLRALGTLPKVQIHYGNFFVSTEWAGLVQPPEFKPPFQLPPTAVPVVAKVGIIRFLGYNPLPCGTSIAERIIVHRKSCGLTKKEFAQQLGVDPSTLAKWERGERKPRGQHLDTVTGRLDIIATFRLRRNNADTSTGP